MFYARHELRNLFWREILLHEQHGVNIAGLGGQIEVTCRGQGHVTQLSGWSIRHFSLIIITIKVAYYHKIRVSKLVCVCVVGERRDRESATLTIWLIK